MTKTENTSQRYASYRQRSGDNMTSKKIAFRKRLKQHRLSMTSTAIDKRGEQRQKRTFTRQIH